jgi:hypothetical protein
MNAPTLPYPAVVLLCERAIWLIGNLERGERLFDGFYISALYNIAQRTMGSRRFLLVFNYIFET